MGVTNECDCWLTGLVLTLELGILEIGNERD